MPSRDHGPTPATPTPATLHVRLLAVPAAASIVRERLRARLGGLGRAELDDVVLAVHEAVSNSVEHGYAGRAAGEIVVRDEGRWRPPSDPGFRGRGIAVMRGCMADVDLSPGVGGTEVAMVSRPVPMSVARVQVHTRVGTP